MQVCQYCNKSYAGRNRFFCSRGCRTALLRQNIAKNIADRFWSFVQKGDGCWEWQGGRYPTGYGVFTIDNKNHRAHRIAYRLTHGDIPASVVVRHTCDNPPCVNPAHLLGGTQSDNVADRNSRGRTAKGDRAGARTHPERRPSFKGERNGRAKLTYEQASAIRQEYATGTIGARPLAEKYGVSRSLIRFIVQGKSWTE